MPKLLVIDDEKNVCYSFEKALASEEIEVVCANSATEGIECVHRESPDAIILDIRLPDFSGLEAFAKIREIDPRLPVIIITAHSTTEMAIEAMRHRERTLMRHDPTTPADPPSSTPPASA